MRAKCIVCPSPGVVDLQENIIEPVAPNEVQIKTEVTAISPGTERAWFLASDNTPAKFPYRPGHCLVGHIVAVGSAVQGYALGDRVLSHAPHASFVSVDVTKIMPVLEGVSSEEAAMVPLAAISLQGIRKAHIELGSPVAIIGMGPIGLFALQLARLAGAYPVVACDISEYRRHLALQAGATAAVGVEDLPKAAKMLENNLVKSSGFHVVIDATGHPAAIHTAIDICTVQARLVLLGSTRGKADGVDFYTIHRKGIQVIGAHNAVRPKESYPGMWTYYDDRALLMHLLRDGIFHLKQFITHRIQPEGAPAFFELLKKRDETLIGCIIQWS